MKILWRILPTLVEVITWDIRTIIAMNDSIWVKHRYYFEDEILSELFCFFISWEKKLQNSIAYIGTDTLPWMYSGCNYDVSFFMFFEWMLLCNCEQLHVISSKRLTKCRPLTDGFEIRVSLYSTDVWLKVRVGVRVRVSKVYLIIIIEKSVFKRKSVVRFVLQSTSWVTIFKVLNVFTSSMPTKIFLLRLILTVGHDFHSHLV